MVRARFWFERKMYHLEDSVGFTVSIALPAEEATRQTGQIENGSNRVPLGKTRISGGLCRQQSGFGLARENGQTL
jgi:hypothetical protein